MSKPWGNIGNWAAEAERAEAEEREAEAAAAAAGSQNFPSLREAVTAKPKKKKPMTLSEFTKGSYASGGGAALEYQGLTPDEMLRLPTGPKERSPEEMQFNRLGGGFSNYGRSSGPPMGRGRDREGNGESSWGGGRRSYGGFDEDRRGPNSRVSEFDQPSRADEVDNWASMKKPLPSLDSGRQNRYSSLGGGSGGGFGSSSRADEVDNWAVGKKPVASRSSTFGSGFRHPSVEQDRWTRGAPLESEGERERPRLVLDPRRGDSSANETPAPAKMNRPSPFGAARPREEVLAQKGLDWKKMESEYEAKKTSQPSSAHSSRPSSAQSSRSEQQLQQGGAETAVKARPKVNPFGEAKPREVLLVERGIDWRKVDLDLEHRAVDRPETEEEKILKDEIDNLKKELEKESTINSNKESLDETGADQSSTRAILQQKERELELLIHDLDDKVRFGQKAIERPGSSAGRSSGFSDRPPSRTGSFEDSRAEFSDRPQSRGTGDMWARHSDDRRSFQGSRDRGDDRISFQGARDRGGFLSSRDLNRSRSRERW